MPGKGRLNPKDSNLKVGRWNINGYPIAILLNFSNFFQDKDKIFFEFWEKYKLDSLPGQWDYVEPALFGYAAGRVIESFIKFNLTTYDRIIAHFHEWMTGYRNSLPEGQASPGRYCFYHTCHGCRQVSCRKQPAAVQRILPTYNAEEIAREFNIISKQSAEKLSAQTGRCLYHRQ